MSPYSPKDSFGEGVRGEVKAVFFVNIKYDIFLNDDVSRS
jgi:hypothetical protein